MSAAKPNATSSSASTAGGRTTKPSSASTAARSSAASGWRGSIAIRTAAAGADTAAGLPTTPTTSARRPWAAAKLVDEHLADAADIQRVTRNAAPVA